MLARLDQGQFVALGSPAKFLTKKSAASGSPSTDSFLSAGRASGAMSKVEKVLKDLNLRLARFGDADVVTARSPLSYEVDVPEAHRLHREIAARLGFKTE